MNNLCQIVDDQDTIIGAKPRNEIDFERDYYRVSGLWLVNSKGDVLIAQRLMTKDKDPGKWGPAVAGTVEVGETYESNIYKEAEEEIGLTGIEFTVGPKMKSEHPRKSFTQWFRAACDKAEEEFTLQATEVEGVKWISRDDLIKDVATNPENYIPAMPRIIDELYS